MEITVLVSFNRKGEILGRADGSPMNHSGTEDERLANTVLPWPGVVATAL